MNDHLLPEHRPRRPLDEAQPDGDLESDRDYLVNNNDLAVALLDRHASQVTIDNVTFQFVIDPKTVAPIMYCGGEVADEMVQELVEDQRQFLERLERVLGVAQENLFSEGYGPDLEPIIVDVRERLSKLPPPSPLRCKPTSPDSPSDTSSP
jgi:hypothetical protein